MNKLRVFFPYILISVLFVGKLWLYSSYIIDGLTFGSLIVSWLIFMAIMLLLLPLGRSNRLIFIFYAICSSLMLADAVYFKYFYQLLTVDVVKLMSLLPTVSDSIFSLMEYKHWLFILDLFIIWRFPRVGEINIKRGTKISLICSSVVVLLIISFSNPGLEFFTFHYNDLTKSLHEDSVATNAQEVPALKPQPQNEFTGLAKGRNLIVVQIEAMQNFVIGRTYNGQEITPFLNTLIKDNSIYFEQYFQQLGRGNTSDAEFVTNNSLYPAMDGPTYKLYYQNNFYGLPWLLREQGYSTSVFHGYEANFWNRKDAYPYQGFERFYSKDDFINEETIGMGINDGDFFTQSIAKMKTMPQPFYAFLVTLSSHHPYVLPEKYQVLELRPEDKGTLLGHYLNAIHYVDSALETFFAYLKTEGLYDNSFICIYGDHHGIILGDIEAKETLSKELGYEYTYDQMMRVPLIMHLPNSNLELRVSKTGGQIDFLPTVLNLFGLQNQKGVMFGQDLLGPGQGFVAEQTYLLKGSFIHDNIIFEMSRDGDFNNSRAWNLQTRQPVPLELCTSRYRHALNEIDTSNYLLKNNLVVPDEVE